MRKEAATDGVGGDNVDNLVATVFVVCAFVEGLSKFRGIATGTLRCISFGRLWPGALSSVAEDSGRELCMEETKLVRESPVVFGGSNSSFVGIGLVIVSFGWDNFKSTVSSMGD